MTETVDLLELAPAAGIHLPRYVHTPPEQDSELTKRMRLLYNPDVPAQIPVTDQLMIDVLRTQSNKYPRRVALDFFGATTTYRQLGESVQRTSALLLEHGVKRGDRVSIVAPNCPQFVYLLYSCLQLGVVCVLHNPLAAPVELKWQIENAGIETGLCVAKERLKRHRTGARHGHRSYFPRCFCGFAASVAFRLATAD